MRKDLNVSNETSTTTDGPQIPPMVKDSSITRKGMKKRSTFRKIGDFFKNLFTFGKKK